MSFTHALSTNRYGESDLIVSTNPANGTHVTLTLAMAAATSGQTIFLRESVTENVTITPGVNISAWSGSTLNTPTIIGTLTMTGAGTSTLSGLRLQTNGAALLAVTGSAASILNVDNCFLNCTNSDGITFSSSSSSAVIRMAECRSDLTTTGIRLFAHSSAGSLTIGKSVLTNNGASTTASTVSAGTLIMNHNQVNFPITLSGTGGIGAGWNDFSCGSLNATALTLGGSGTQGINFSSISSGTASAVSIGGTAALNNCLISSSNAAAIAGAGTLNSSLLSFTSTSNTISTSTQTPNVNRFGVELSTTHPAFLAYLGTQDTDATGDDTTFTLGTGNALTEIYDQNSNFNTNGTFTAPYTARYSLTACITLVNASILVGHVNMGLNIVASNRNIRGTNFNPFAVKCTTPSPRFITSSSIDMDVGDTAVVTISVGISTKTIDIFADTQLSTYFGGFLIC